MNENTNINWYNQHAEDFILRSAQDDMSWPYSDFLSALTQTPAKILDLGCGPGRDLVYFKNKGYQVEGLDASETFCQHAEKISHARIIHQKFSELNLEPESYDGIFANAVLMHIEPKDREAFLKEIFCALRTNGIFYAHFPKGLKSEQSCDGRTLHLTPNWVDLCRHYTWELELNEGRPKFFSPEEQTWQVIRFRKN